MCSGKLRSTKRDLDDTLSSILGFEDENSQDTSRTTEVFQSSWFGENWPVQEQFPYQVLAG